VKGPRSDPAAGIPDARDQQADQMSILNALEAREKFHGSYDDRLHVWFAADTPRGADEAGYLAIGEAAVKHDVRLTMHCAEAAKDFDMIQEHYKHHRLDSVRTCKRSAPTSYSHIWCISTTTPTLIFYTALDQRGA